MNSPLTSKDEAWSRAVVEASTWIALLHGTDRSEATDRGLQRWLADDALNAKAFELATETWENTRGAVRRAARVELVFPGVDARGRAGTWVRGRGRTWRVLGWRGAVGVAASVCLVLVGVVIGWRLLVGRADIGTEIGERRTVVLVDGTQVNLNTATRIRVDYDRRERRVRLESGEALFEVAKDSGRPFSVSVGDRRVVALGTSFIVRRDDDQQIAVTLIDGKVAMSSVGSMDATGSMRAEEELVPGQRVTLTGDEPAKLDRPEIEKLTAWERGRVNIDDSPLVSAVAEMNRYSRTKIVVDGAAAERLRVSGIFRAGDSRNFAEAVAQTHGLQIRVSGGQIVLSGMPSS